MFFLIGMLEKKLRSDQDYEIQKQPLRVNERDPYYGFYEESGWGDGCLENREETEGLTDGHIEQPAEEESTARVKLMGTTKKQPTSGLVRYAIRVSSDTGRT